MVRVSEYILSFLLNSIWQLPVIWLVAMVGAFVLRNGTARHRHLLWVTCMLLSILVPVLSVTPLVPDSLPRFEANHRVLSKPTFSPTTSSTQVSDSKARPQIDRSGSGNRQVVSTSTNRALIFSLLYCVFIFCCLIRFVRLWRRKEQLKQKVILSVPKQIEVVRDRCRGIFGLQNVRIGRSELIRVPCTLGASRPFIVLPNLFCLGMNEEILVSVIGHEMAHISRKDFLTKLICEFASLPISFHPITFLIKKRIEQERELACDELVTERLLPRQAYAKSLLTAAGMSLPSTSGNLMLTIFDGKMLEERIMRLTKHHVMTGRRAGRAAIAGSILALMISALALPVFSVELRTQVETVIKETLAAKPVEAQVISQDVPVSIAPDSAQTTSKSTAPQERAEAACAAGRAQDAKSIPTLIAMLGDDTKTELIRCWDNGNWSPALATFKHPSSGEQAAIALASMGRAAYPALASQLSSPSAIVRRNAAWAIGELTNMLPGERTTSGPQLTSLLSDPDEWVRMAAARALGEIRDRQAVETLIVSLSDTDWRVREMATWALSELKEPRAVQALCNVLIADSRFEVRRRAAEALGEIQSEEALPSLKQALNDPEAGVSAKARWAINEIEDTVVP